MRLSGFETPSSADAIIKSRYFLTPRFSKLSEVPNDWSAKQLGMKTIWVKQGFGSLWNITDESEKADMEINNLSDVLKYL